MSFQISTRFDRAGDREGAVYILADRDENVRAEVWPMAGFNCLRWQFRQPDGSWGDALYSAPDWSANPVPTRSGHPILFPFPNRLAGGRMTSAGREYQLPRNDATKSHAIHGFAPRVPWTVLGSGVTDQCAFIRGRFTPMESESRLWPGDLSLTVTYTLSKTSLRVEAEVANGNSEPAPYGLGYHGYLRLPDAPSGEMVNHWLFQCRTETLWECFGNIPTGQKLPCPAPLNFAVERPLGPVEFDTLLTGLAPRSGLGEIATLRHPDRPGTFRVLADESFPHLVLFTPAHRQALAIEPYTCTTDAPHLTDLGIECGWPILAPGAKKRHFVEYRWESR